MQLAILGDGGLGREVEAAASAEGHGVGAAVVPGGGAVVVVAGATVVSEADTLSLLP